MPAGDARGRVRMAAGGGLNESTRRWLISPQGLLAACRDAVSEGDDGFLDELDASPLLASLDDESLQSPGPSPSERARALVSAGRLALWCLKHPDGTEVEKWLVVATRGFSGPDEAPWASPGGRFEPPSATDPQERAAALVSAASGACAHPALLPISDLLQDFITGPQETEASPSARVPLLISRHQQGELVHFMAVQRAGPPGAALDPLVGPFTRADAAFHEAVNTAWKATGSPSLSARWSIISDRTGAAVEVIGGRSVGAAAGTVLRHLSTPTLVPLNASWPVVGALDASGTLVSLLDDDRNLTSYRTKLEAAGDRTVLVPRCDHAYITSIVEAGGLKARLRPVASLTDITELARRDAAASGRSSRGESGRDDRSFVSMVLIVAVAAVAAAVVARARGMGLLTASAMGAISVPVGWAVVGLTRRRSWPRVWTAAALATACVVPVGVAGLHGGGPDRPRPPQTMRTFELPAGSEPAGLVADKHGNLWFAETAHGRIGRINSAGEKYEFAIPEPPGDAGPQMPSGPRPQTLAMGPDGNIWFLAYNLIGKVTPNGQFTLFRLDGPGNGGLVAGPDGNMWVTQQVPKIARVTPTGQITEFPIPLDGKNFQSQWDGKASIAVGRDGNLWFTEARGRIGRITPAGDVKEFTLPTPDAEPGGIIAGPDGNLWFAIVGVKGKIGQITPSGKITEFDLMRLSQPQHLAVGPDGAIWFTELGMTGSMTISGAGRLGRIDPKAPDEFPWYLPLPNDLDPTGLVTGGDGNLWFTERKKHQIVTLPAVPPLRIRSVGPEVGQRFLAAFEAFNSEFTPADEQLVAARAGTDLERMKASYARQGEILRSFATTLSGLEFPPAVGDQVRAVNDATSAVLAVTDEASNVSTEAELRLGDDRIGLTLARADAFDSWFVALNGLGTQLGLGRTRSGPVAAGKGPPQPTTSRTVPPTLPVPPTIPAGRAAISGEKFPPVTLDAKGKSDRQQWPEACTMLTDVEIDAITPGLTVTRTVLSGSWTIGQTPKNAYCTYELRGPSIPSGFDWISVNLIDIATPTSGPGSFQEAKVMAAAGGRLRPENYKDYGTTLGADEAFWDGHKIECLKGPFRFSVSGSTSRRSVGGEWRDKVLTEVVRTLSAKMS